VKLVIPFMVFRKEKDREKDKKTETEIGKERERERQRERERHATRSIPQVHAPSDKLRSGKVYLPKYLATTKILSTQEQLFHT
jgi:hypothetical protein